MRTLAVVTLIAAMTCAMPALAAPRDEAGRALEAYQTICSAHRLNQDGALKAAEAKGWKAVSDADLAATGGLHEVIKGLHITRTAARRSPEGLVLLLGEEDGDSLSCVIGMDAPFAAATSVMGGWMPVPRFDKLSPAYDLWAYVERDGRKLAVKDRAGKIDEVLLERARTDGSLAFIAVIGRMEGDGAIFVQSVPKPVAKPIGSPASAAMPHDRLACQRVRDDWASKYPERRKLGELRPETVRARFQRYDRECDGRLSVDEYAAMEWAAVAYWDADGDEKISREEYMDRRCGADSKSPYPSRELCEKALASDFRWASNRVTGVIDRRTHRRDRVRRFRTLDQDRNGFLTLSSDQLYE